LTANVSWQYTMWCPENRGAYAELLSTTFKTASACSWKTCRELWKQRYCGVGSSGFVQWQLISGIKTANL